VTTSEYPLLNVFAFVFAAFGTFIARRTKTLRVQLFGFLPGVQGKLAECAQTKEHQIVCVGTSMIQRYLVALLGRRMNVPMSLAPS
jgi:hypothetical protein